MSSKTIRNTATLQIRNDRFCQWKQIMVSFQDIHQKEVDKTLMSPDLLCIVRCYHFLPEAIFDNVSFSWTKPKGHHFIQSLSPFPLCTSLLNIPNSLSRENCIPENLMHLIAYPILSLSSKSQKFFMLSRYKIDSCILQQC